MNFLFVSPQFPKYYWNFCDRLKREGVTVLGLGDAPYNDLTAELRGSLAEYFYLPSLENYEDVYRAVAFLSYKHGKMDWIESNNEYWLEQDARLRTDFHVTTGEQIADIGRLKHKSAMKRYYAEAGIKTARLHQISDIDVARTFIADVGYPVIVKPDVGVGANNTYKLSCDADLERFFATRPDAPYVTEEFITGDIYSYDAIVDATCEPLFESMTVWGQPIMDIVLNGLDLSYYVDAGVPDDLRAAGRATVKAFNVRSRFVHLEFFRLTQAKPGLGNVGDLVGLEVNMRPAGGYTTDMMNFAHSTDVYQIYAEMVAHNERRKDAGVQQCCAYAGRRDGVRYAHSDDEVWSRYGGNIVMSERMPMMMVPQMGNYMFTATLPNADETRAFIDFVTERQK